MAIRLTVKIGPRLLLTLALGAPAFGASAHGNAGAFADKHDDVKAKNAIPNPQQNPVTPETANAQTRKPAPVARANVPAREIVKIMRAEAIQLVPAAAGRHAARLRTYGRVIANPAAITDVNAFISGEVRRVLVRAGAHVREGETVATIYSPEFVRTQKSYLALLQNKALQTSLREEGRLPNYMKDARANLRWWGLSEQDILRLEKSGDVREELALTADADGVVTDVFVQPGQLLSAGDNTMKQFVVLGKSMMRIVATDAPLWVEGYLYPGEEQAVRTGTPAILHLPNGKRVQRKVMKVISTVDERAQRARFLIAAHADDRLPLGASLELDLHLEETDGVWIPAAAVLNQGLAPIVYVRAHATAFERRPIQILQTGHAGLRVGNVDANEMVVTAGKMLLEGNYRMGAGGAPAAHDH